MKTLLLPLVLLLCISAQAQSIQEEDQTPRFLVDPAVNITIYPTLTDSIYFNGEGLFWNIPVIDDTYIFDPVQITPYPYPGPFYWDFSNLTITFANPCGEYFHDNGIMSSRCECNADSILHGKSVYWDEQGRIRSVSHYFDGKLYSEKLYDEGDISSLSNYTYKNGDRQLHGKQIEYTAFGKTISNYTFGIKSGIETEYNKGYKYRESTFNNGTLAQAHYWSENGIPIRSEYYDENGQKTGTWTEHNPTANTDKKTTYLNGKRTSEIETKDGIVIHRFVKNEDRSELDEIFYDDGTPKQQRSVAADLLVTNKGWLVDGTPAYDYQFRDNKIIGQGFILEGSGLIHFKQVKNTDGTQHLECYKTNKGDTLSFFYSHNNGNLHRDIIRTNEFVQRNGNAVKHGEWVIYKNNKVVSLVTYNAGVKHGKIVSFDTTGQEPIPYLIGAFYNGQKHDTWVYRTKGDLVKCNYENGALNGTYESFSRNADTTFFTQLHRTTPQGNRQIRENLTPKVVAHYTADQLHGDYRSFYQDGHVHWTGRYQNGTLAGRWLEITNAEIMLSEANFDASGSLQKESYIYTWKGFKRGKNRYKKQRMRVFVTPANPFIPMTYEEQVVKALQSQPL